ncbi:FRG domain-containing protein [Fusibacter sp. 3D3]|uniref:FRG domain-containing protein n=1 Tax=Fusibacter sp. 3D3 TaxID=1048380 RepID=UPI000853D5B2|nr:FRG domain-containing protein [Fusibacter sp. 3D3]GAU78571.1 hypothetical protein F3D3_3205 [Fusibacter sp. 3D3]
MGALYKKIVITDWNHFEEEIKNHRYKRWIYRGQNNSKYGLSTSLERLFQYASEIGVKIEPNKNFPINYKRKYEKELLDEFKKSAHIYISNLPNENYQFEWLSIMQHFGVPTRLLDFTYSPFVALFFALDNAKSDFAIFAIRSDNFWEIEVDSELEDLKSNHEIMIYEPIKSNERLLAQQGLFLVANTLKTPVERLINKAIPVNENNDSEFIKYIFGKELRKEFFVLLKKMNITSTTLYPGFTGYCSALPWNILGK